MKKKHEARDFVIGTYPLNAYPDPWDFVVDNYDIIIIEVDRSTNDYELNLRSTIVYRTYKVNDHALEKRGIRRMLEVWHFCRLNYFLCYSSGGFLRSSIANYSICDSVIFIISLLLHLIRFAILFCILFQINIDYGKLLSPNHYPPNPLNIDAQLRHSYF